MNKNLIVITLAAILLAGCTQPNATGSGPSQANGQDPQATDVAASNQMIDAGSSEDPDGFVRMPGEPSRGDSVYYVTGEVCEQFTQKFMEGILGKTITNAEPSYKELTNCQYSFGEAGTNGVVPNVILSLSFLSIETQVKGHQILGRTAEADASIPMENYVIKQKDGLINEIYLVLGPNKFLSINRSSGKAVSEEEIIEIARKLAEKIKTFK